MVKLIAGHMVYRTRFCMKPDSGQPLRFTVSAHRVTPEEEKCGFVTESMGAYTGTVQVYSLQSAKQRAQTQNRRFARDHQKQVSTATHFFKDKRKLIPMEFPVQITQPH